MVGEKFSPSGTGAILETPPLPPGGGGGSIEVAWLMNFPGGFVVFLFFLASEEKVPKQLKQVSIVGKGA